MSLTLSERAALILKVRGKTDPCCGMVLTPTQQKANESTARYQAVRGVNRGGKTAYSAWKLSRVARRLPNNKTTQVNGVYIVFAPSRSQITDPWAKKLVQASEVKGELFNHPFIPEHEILHKRYTHGAGEPTLSLIELKNGNKIFFTLSGDKNIWKRIEGKGCILGVVIDESAGNPALLAEIMVRLLDANSNEQVNREAGGAWLLWAATQTKKSPAFEQFLSICQSDAEEHKDYEAFTLLPGENPAIDQAEREKLAIILSEDDYKIRMEGHGSAATAMSLYPQWDDARNYTKPDCPYVSKDDDNLWVGYDPGTHYTGIIIAAINRAYPLRLNVVKVWQPQRTTLEFDVRLIRDWLQGRKLEGWVYDQAARKVDKASGKSVLGVLNEITQRHGYDIHIHRGFMKGTSFYEKSVPLVRRYLKCEPGDSGHPTNVIVNGDVDSGGPLLRYQIMNCAYTEKAYEMKEENIVKGDDHVSDTLRYLISRQPCFVDRGMNPKLWGEGTAGIDPDAHVEKFEKGTMADKILEPRQIIARQGAERRLRMMAKRQRSSW